MLLTMGVSLYTSRVVLNTLGVEDFGIYNVVGGVIVMFGFLNSSMSGATSRFLTFELGRQDYEKLKKTFSAALTVHFIIAGIILILGETIGLWFLENKLVITPERMDAAQWVYQLSILSTMISITQVPYNAMIISHERMRVFAVIEIINKLLLLGIIFIVATSDFDKLIFYAVLMLGVSVIIAMSYRIYCIKHFSESHYKFEWNKEIMKPMVSFSGWNLFGNIAYVAKGQGNNVLLNLFFGTIVNAAYSIAATIQGVVVNFVSSFQTAVNPQITKNYASKNYEQFLNLLYKSSRLSFCIMLIPIVPILFNVDYILKLWLKIPPLYSNSFITLCLINSLIDTVSNPLITGAMATGKIKIYQLVLGTLLFLNLPVSYVLLLFYKEPTTMYWVSIVISGIVLIFRIKFLERMINLNVKDFLLQVVNKITLTCVPICGIVYLFYKYWGIAHNIKLLIFQSCTLALLSVFCVLLFGIKRTERQYIYSVLTNKISKYL
ncbi:MAG: oligosaccharide flippase family protein [Paludibacter sp.]|nr:oligosaccharide flippase family protein [Paludibacter sp.]